MFKIPCTHPYFQSMTRKKKKRERNYPTKTGFYKNLIFHHLKLIKPENASLSHHTEPAWMIRPTWLKPKQVSNASKVYTPGFYCGNPGIRTYGSSC